METSKIESVRSVLTIAINNLKLAQDKYLEFLDNKLLANAIKQTQLTVDAFEKRVAPGNIRIRFYENGKPIERIEGIGLIYPYTEGKTDPEWLDLDQAKEFVRTHLHLYSAKSAREDNIFPIMINRCYSYNANGADDLGIMIWEPSDKHRTINWDLAIEARDFQYQLRRYIVETLKKLAE